MSSQKQVYLIDDDRSIRESVTLVLSESGYQVLPFADPKKFLSEFNQSTNPEVVLLDMKMPVMDGLELQRQILDLGIKVPIIFISAHSHREQIIRGFKSGAMDFLIKPFTIQQLIISIDEALSRDAEYKLIKNKYQLLTPREKEVFELLAKGELLKTIANKWDVSESVLKIHKKNIMKKLAINSLQDLAKVDLFLNSSDFKKSL
jgi:FixJ family two-component response regulator